MAKEAEYETKTKKSKVDVSVVPEVEDKIVLKEIEKLSAKFRAMSSLKKEIADLKSDMATLKKPSADAAPYAPQKFALNISSDVKVVLFVEFSVPIVWNVGRVVIKEICVRASSNWSWMGEVSW